MPWILWSITTSLRKKRKRRFFIGFAIFSVIWIGSYPMLWLLSWAVPEYTRAQVMLGLEICLAHGSQTILVILIFPLWPNFQITLCGKKWGFGCFPFHKVRVYIYDHSQNQLLALFSSLSFLSSSLSLSFLLSLSPLSPLSLTHPCSLLPAHPLTTTLRQRGRSMTPSQRTHGLLPLTLGGGTEAAVAQQSCHPQEQQATRQLPPRARQQELLPEAASETSSR